MLKHTKKENGIRTIQATCDVISRLNDTFAERLLSFRQDNNEPAPTCSCSRR
ncbi:hypothetical protein VSR82_25590 [Burkholderia sp. JPY481]